MALVGLVAVSHSRALTETAAELPLQMMHGTRPEIVIAAGIPERGFGTDAAQVADTVRATDRGTRMVILTDLGSAVLSAEFAMELVGGANAILVATPFVEGLLAATVHATTGGAREEVADEARATLGPKLAALEPDFPADKEPPEKPSGVPRTADAETRVTLPNASGLHAHPTALLMAEAGCFDAEVRLRCHDVEGGASSPITLAILNAQKGDEVQTRACGPQTANAVATLESLISNGLGESTGAPGATVAAPADPQGVSPGQIVDVARLMTTPPVDPPAEAHPLKSQPPGEKTHLKTVLEEVAVGYKTRTTSFTGEAAQIMLAVVTLARDPELLQSAQALIDTLGVGAATVVQQAASDVVARLKTAGGFLVKRTTDITDICDCVICHPTGHLVPSLPDSGEPFMLVAHDLVPSNTASLKREHYLGIVATGGGPTSHTSVLARSMGTPAVVGFRDALTIPDGAEVLVGGTSSEVVVSSDETQRAGACTTSSPLEPLSAPGKTRDGASVSLLANMGSVAKVQAAAGAGTEGIGLFRIEICFLDADVEPDPEQQFIIYRDTLAQFSECHVMVHTLDTGNDRPMPFLTILGEGNPVLGVRGYRIAAHRPGVLARQLGTMARAPRENGVGAWVMAPMISTPAEAAEFTELARAAGLGTVGVMMEIPSAALQAEGILSEMNFVSIGTNDLTQYAAATDRQVSRLSGLQDPWQPAVLRLSGMIGRTGRLAGKPVGVYGEAAADPALATVLVGLGVTSLSMTLRALEPVRRALARVTVENCRRAAEVTFASSDPTVVREEVFRVLEMR